MAEGTRRRGVWMLRAIAVLMALIGLAIGVGGIVLLTLGGSPYYLAGGVAVFASAVLLWRRSALGLHLYALFMVVTLVWALWEAGADGWALAPRLIAPAVIGLLLGLPPVRRTVTAEGARGALWSAFGVSLAALLVLTGIAAATAGAPASGAPIALQPVAVGGLAGEWPAWGRTSGGDRFSPLAQITPQNVAALQPAWTYHTGVVQGLVKSSLEVTPLMVGDSLYLCTQTNVVIALDPEPGGRSGATIRMSIRPARLR